MTSHPSPRPTRQTPASRGGTRVRGTQQAEALHRVLADLSEFRSAQDIHGELRRRGEGIGLTTVYRHLQVLSQDGTVDTLRDETGETRYRRCRTSAHHHHVTCRSCGHTVEVEGPAIERWAEHVAAEAGFTDINHTVEIFGLCPDCAPVRLTSPATRA
ncbi:transcriptional repressor [Actinomadura soli]|uniref:Transcriptional repressor n=1 Tax=Actinomadura soli TaxID=2508997 RepID=A0A5C4J604_9ACTN|nr:Fur family transcriptional regulator [Actinomadura soli]TMQ92907.1 transcriptional repressor [Actinomadura soli]